MSGDSAAYIAAESDATHLETRLVAAERSYASAMVTYEATLGIARSLNISIGNALSFTFTGKVEGDTMSGELDLGEYLKARWSAKRHRYGQG